MAYPKKTPGEEFEEQVQGDNYYPSWEEQQEFCAEEGEEIDKFLGRTTEDPFAGCDKRDQRVEYSERDGRLRHKPYDELIENYIVPAIRQKPELFKILRDTFDAGEVAYQLARLIENPQLAERQEFRGIEEYLRDVASRKTGTFDNLSPDEFERMLRDYKEHADDGETIEEFFNR